MKALGETQFSRRSDGHIAWRRGTGDAQDVLVFQAAFYPMDCLDDAPVSMWSRRMVQMGRMLVFDRRGVGESDPIDPKAPPTPRDWALDAVSILDDAGIDRCAVVGFHDGGLAAVHLAAEFPGRVSKLVLVNTFALFSPTSDFPQAGIAEYREQFRRIAEEGPAAPVDLWDLVAPSVADDIELRAWFNKVGRTGASPSTATALTHAMADWDVRNLLLQVQAPTLVVHRAGNRFVAVEQARYLASAIPGANLAEVEGIDHLTFVGDVDALFDPIEEFLTGSRDRRPDRMLATILFTDLVSSTEQLASLGDRRWRGLIQEHDMVAATVVAEHDGRIVSSTGDGILAMFALPANGVRAAAALRDRLASKQLRMRAGLHTGEIEVVGDNVTGLAVYVAARVMAHAAAGEILTSHAVPPLVVGADLEFLDVGPVELKGVPGAWRLARAII